MVNTNGHKLKVKTSSYEIIASGVAHLTESEVTFELANLVIKYIFKSDLSGARLKADASENTLNITLYNFDNSLGQGKIEPMEIGTLSGKKLFATFYVNTMEKSLRQFNYTFMLKEP